MGMVHGRGQNTRNRGSMTTILPYCHERFLREVSKIWTTTSVVAKTKVPLDLFQLAIIKIGYCLPPNDYETNIKASMFSNKKTHANSDFSPKKHRAPNPSFPIELSGFSPHLIDIAHQRGDLVGCHTVNPHPDPMGIAELGQLQFGTRLLP